MDFFYTHTVNNATHNITRTGVGIKLNVTLFIHPIIEKHTVPSSYVQHNNIYKMKMKIWIIFSQRKVAGKYSV